MKQAKAFYKTAAWLKCRKVILIRDHYLCQECLRNDRLTPANTVHHIIPLEEAPELALEESNLESICPTCHNRAHPEKGGGKPKPTKKRRIKIVKVKANEELV